MHAPAHSLLVYCVDHLPDAFPFVLKSIKYSIWMLIEIVCHALHPYSYLSRFKGEFRVQLANKYDINYPTG